MRSQRLFKLVRARTRTDRDVLALLDELERRAELFVAVGDPNHAYWADLPSAKPYVRELNLFRACNASSSLGVCTLLTYNDRGHPRCAS